MRKFSDCIYLPDGLMNTFRDLASMTPADEPWNMGENKRYLLQRYLDYWWNIIQEQNLLVCSGDLAAFNTGLLTPSWDTIYGILHKGKDGNHQPFSLVAFTTTNTSKGKLLAKLPYLPNRPVFWNSVNQLHYDPSMKHLINLDHLRDRIERFGFSNDFLKKIQDPDCEVSPKDRVFFDCLRDHLKKDQSASMILNSAIQGVISQAFKRAEADPFCATACYNPRKKEVSLLLPISTGEPEKVDSCLVVTKEGSNYVGSTVLTLTYASANARLMGRVSSSWLQAN